MKEFIFCIQFLLSQETYYIDGNRHHHHIDGVFAFNTSHVYLVVDGQREEFNTTAVRQMEKSYFISFEDGNQSGTAYVNPKEVILDVTTREKPMTHLVHIKYTVKLTNLE